MNNPVPAAPVLWLASTVGTGILENVKRFNLKFLSNIH
jgi:hypothetical protein